MQHFILFNLISQIGLTSKIISV